MAISLNHLIAYPDGHPDKETDEEGELEFLKQKVDAGGDFIITQLFYDVDSFLAWVTKVRQKGANCASFGSALTGVHLQASLCPSSPESCPYRRMHPSCV